MTGKKAREADKAKKKTDELSMIVAKEQVWFW
jgi:hypothetical protein